MEDGNGFIGLGYNNNNDYSHASSTTTPTFRAATTSTTAPTTTVPPATTASAATGNEAADTLMSAYMTQILDYHRQETERQKHGYQFHQHNPQLHFGTNATNAASSAAAVGTPLHQQQPHYSTTTEVTTLPSAMPSQSHGGTIHAGAASTATQEGWQQAVQNARLIALRLQQQPQPPQNTSIPTSISIPQQQPPPTNYSQQREQYNKIESIKFQKYYLKNLEYIAKKDEEQYHQTIQHLNYTKQMQHQYDVNYTQCYQQKQQQHQQQKMAAALNSSHAGIGTSNRSKLEKQKKYHGHTPSTAMQKKYNNSLYISNLNVTSKTVQEEEMLEGTIQQLFGTYGTLERVTLYRDKKSRRLKGDGLIVYDVPSSLLKEEGEEVKQIHRKEREEKEKVMAERILKDVCTQLNGAELPCGSVISVEPADLDYKSKNTKQQGNRSDDLNGDVRSTHVNANGSSAGSSARVKHEKRMADDVGYYGPAAGATVEHVSSSKESMTGDKNAASKQEKAATTTVETVEEETDDLDDFFASLT